MKKSIALLLTLTMVLACFSALAENVRFVESSPDFDIEMPLPEGAAVGSKAGVDQVSIVEIKKDGMATVHITVAPSDIYDKQSMNDLSDEDVEALKAVAGAQYDAPDITVDVTPSGNKYIHVCANSDYDVDAIFTLYMGYFLELTQWHDDYSKITDEDYGFMQQLLYNIEFLPVK